MGHIGKRAFVKSHNNFYIEYLFKVARVVNLKLVFTD